jgi:hypothetical protein
MFKPIASEGARLLPRPAGDLGRSNMDNRQTATPGRDDTDAMLGVLAADGPHPRHAGALMLYGQLVGSWAVDNRYLDQRDGDWHEVPAAWHFGWILDGLGVQDVLVGPAQADPEGQRGIGTTVRVYDPRMDAWRVSWFGATSGEFCTLIGRPDGGGILQEGSGTDGRPIRWRFTDISPESFRWQGLVSDDGGATWRLEQEMHGRRQRPAPAAAGSVRGQSGHVPTG